MGDAAVGEGGAGRRDGGFAEAWSADLEQFEAAHRPQLRKRGHRASYSKRSIPTNTA